MNFKNILKLQISKAGIILNYFSPHTQTIQSLLNDGVRWYSDNPNIQVFISFTVNITASHLKKIRYSPYQQDLWEIIKEKYASGMGYRKISYWLNESGYKTPRGLKFKNSHVHSILKKKRIAEEKLVKRYEPKIMSRELKLFYKVVIVETLLWSVLIIGTLILV